MSPELRNDMSASGSSELTHRIIQHSMIQSFDHKNIAEHYFVKPFRELTLKGYIFACAFLNSDLSIHDSDIYVRNIILI